MTPKPVAMTDKLFDYLLANGSAPDDVQRDLIEETERRFPGNAGMRTSPDQGAFFTLLARLVNARFAVEVGTFTGYSSLCIARGLAPRGKLLCCDISDEWTSVARKYWERAGVAERIDLRLGPAAETLRALPDEPTIDLSYLDADKTGYIRYWDEIVPRVRPGGVILVDNVLSHGRVVESGWAHNETVAAIRAFNDHAMADDRVDVVMLPLSDGLTIARKR